MSSKSFKTRTIENAINALIEVRDYLEFKLSQYNSEYGQDHAIYATCNRKLAIVNAALLDYRIAFPDFQRKVS